jgi:hypothetical protein
MNNCVNAAALKEIGVLCLKNTEDGFKNHFYNWMLSDKTIQLIIAIASLYAWSIYFPKKKYFQQSDSYGSIIEFNKKKPPRNLSVPGMALHRNLHPIITNT